MKKIRILFTLALFQLTAFSQNSYKYYSSGEEKAISAMLSKKAADTFEAMYYVAGNSEFEIMKLKSKLDAYFEENKGKLLQTNKLKAFKHLHKSIQKSFFKKYTDSAQLFNIYRDGGFNCLTGTMVYTYVLRKMNVPFQIVELPGHVYVKTRYENKEYNFETTNPEAKGVFVITTEQKERVVEELVRNKLLTEDEYKLKGADKCYQEYYFDTGVLNMGSLIGMAYYNSALFAAAAKNYEKAIEQYEKCKLFYKTKETENLQAICAGYYIDEETKKKDYSFNVLKIIIQKNKYLNPLTMEEWFNTISKRMVMENSRLQEYQKLEPMLENYLHKDSSYTSTIKYSFYAIIGDYYNKKNNTDSSLKYYGKAYQYNRNNINLNSVILQSLVQSEIEYAKVYDSYLKEKYGKTLTQGEINNKNSYEFCYGIDTIEFEPMRRRCEPIYNYIAGLDSQMFFDNNIAAQIIYIEYEIVYPICTKRLTNPDVVNSVERLLLYLQSNKFKLPFDIIKFWVTRIPCLIAYRGDLDLIESFLQRMEGIFSYEPEIKKAINDEKNKLEMFRYMLQEGTRDPW